MEEHLSSEGAKRHASGRKVPVPNGVLRESTAATTFVAAIKWLDDGGPVVSVTGDLDLATASAFEDALLGAARQSAGAVTVDLAQCTFIDLRGLRVLLAMRERLERSNRQMRLVVGKPSLLRILNVTRTAESFELYSSLAAAAKVNGHG